MHEDQGMLKESVKQIFYETGTNGKHLSGYMAPGEKLLIAAFNPRASVAKRPQSTQIILLRVFLDSQMPMS